MEILNTTRAQVLVDALPYIQKYHQKIVVIKYGGNAMTNEILKNAVMGDIVLLSLIGIKVVLVHGGGPEISETLTAMGKTSKFIDGLRYTDKETAEVVQMVLAGKINKDLVALLQKHGGNALGLCGIDGGMIRARKMKNDVDLGYVGEIKKINTAPILNAIKDGYIPVIATVGSDKHGQTYNINADTAAASIAAALGAENVILMTDIRGLLKDKDDDSTLLSVVKASEVPLLKMQGVIEDGMIPKVDCCVDAVRRGVDRAFIIDGRVKHSILIEMLSSEGIGTMFLG